jgi:thiol-disulfide isomerase/thioredoxin
MKTIIKTCALLVAIALLTLGATAQKNTSYKINADVKGVPDGTMFFLIKAASDGDADTVQTVVSKNGTFSFNGKLNVEGEMHWVKMDTSKVKIGSKRIPWITLLLTNSAINIESEFNKWPSVILKGTQATVDLKEFLKYDSISSAKVKYLYAQKPDSIEIKKISEDYHNSLLDFINRHPDSYILPWIIRTFSPEKLEDKDLAFGKLSDKLKNSFYGRKLKSDIMAARLNLKSGSVMPDFKINMLNGKSQFVKEIVADAKLTLIDFWGSWCKPCRDEVPGMKKVYDAFHDRGFNILGVACNDKDASWRKAIKDDNSNWLHGKDDFENASSSIFKLRSWPAIVLVDQQGKIIASYGGLSSVLKTFGPALRGNNGDELYKTVENILK